MTFLERNLISYTNLQLSQELQTSTEIHRHLTLSCFNTLFINILKIEVEIRTSSYINAEHATQTNGTSSTGLIFSSGTMAQKLGGAISGSLIALLLGIAGLVSETDILTGETIVTITNEETVRTMVWSLFSLFPAAIALLMGILAYKFPLKK